MPPTRSRTGWGPELSRLPELLTFGTRRLLRLAPAGSVFVVAELTTSQTAPTTIQTPTIPRAISVSVCVEPPAETLMYDDADEHPEVRDQAEHRHDDVLDEVALVHAAEGDRPRSRWSCRRRGTCRCCWRG